MLVLVRITVNGKSIQFGTQVDVDPKLWNVTAGKLVRKTQEVINTNSVLDNIKATMTKIYRELSSVLNSPLAIQINISIIRAFVTLRKYALGYA